MQKLANPREPSGLGLFCEHLAANDDLDEYGRYYTGEGAKYALVCPVCIAEFNEEQRLPALVPVVIEKFEELESGLCDGVIGAPSYLTRETELQFRHEHYPCDFDIIAAHGDGERWLGLSREGDLVDLTENRSLSRLPRGQLSYDHRVELYSSADYVIAVNTLGRFGMVYCLEAGRVVLDLDRGSYHTGVSRFPIALVADRERQLLIHATSWNQLHITDLQARRAVNDRQVEDRLDYFHAGLSVSPGGDWVVSNGWIWHPMGTVRCWSLRSWLDTNAFEAEDGSSVKHLCRRDHYWDGPICWVDTHTLAVWGHGDDSLWMTPAVLFFDVRSGGRVGWFPGPEIEGGELFGARSSSGGERATVPGFLAFDTYLYSISPTRGTSVWDVSTGEQLLQDPSHRPVAYSNGKFLTLEKGKALVSRLGGNW